VENNNKTGMPQLIVRDFNIGVPSEFGNTIQVISSDYSSLNGKLIPVARRKKDAVSFVESFSEAAGYSSQKNPDVVTFGEFGLIRELPVQTIKIYPVQFEGSSNTIKLLRRVRFKISYSTSKAGVRTFSDMTLSSAVINWNVARNWGISSSKKLSKVSGSVLATGDWFRFETPTEGIYKIDQPFLQSLGINVTSIDPRTIKIYGYGGYALPEDLSLTNNQGLTETAIYVFGESDGKFDTGDYILFYGRPTEAWEYVAVDGRIERIKNPFSKKNYYWLTYGSSTGKRMSQKQSVSVQSSYKQQTTQAFRSLDRDSVNLGKSGREYFGDQFDNNTPSRTYLTTLNGIVPSSTVNYKVRLVNTSYQDVPYTVEESGIQIYGSTLFQLTDYYYGKADENATGVYNGPFTDERSRLKFTIQVGSTGSAIVYLDYFEIGYIEQLKAANDNLFFFSRDTTAAINYTLNNFSSSSIQTFDLTDYANVKMIGGANISGGQFTFTANETAGKVSKYLGITPASYLTPANGTKMTNSNVRGNISGSQMIVITPKVFQTQAERFAAYRSSQSKNKQTAQVFYIEDIMNEFAGGVTDPTAIRDFLKFAYDNWQIKPFYVLLFGNGTYDILNMENQNNNFIPAYETEESLSQVDSYPTDDYYARVSGNDGKVDLAIGRLPLRSTNDAQSVVDKIIKYETGLEQGIWRSTITLCADDGPAGPGEDDGSIHTAQSEDLANTILPKYLFQDKIYLVAYPTTFNGLGRRKPGVNQAIIDAINNGTLIINWVGHGNPDVWAHEDVFDINTTIPQIKNTDYFFLSAATCDFGKYDRPAQQSCTEILVNMPNSGAIEAFCSARVSFSTWNAALNDSFYVDLFGVRDQNNLPVNIGQAYFLAKQFIHDQENDEKFHLFGDPAIKLDQPQSFSRIDSINGKNLQSPVQLNALSSVKIKGSVLNSSGTVNPYNGEGIISVFDSKISIYYQEMDYTVTFPGGLIYRGRATINNGIFQTDFVVPKDISYENQNGKVIAYVYNNTSDGIGYTDNIIVGGTNQNAKNDSKGPDIAIYFDDLNFKNSYLVNPDFTLLAKISDQSGLNTTGTGIGHKLEGILNGDETNAIDFTSSFIGDLDSGGKSGMINYKFTGMKPGDYTIRIKAWDVFNNFSTQDASFTIVNADNGIVVRDVYNYPNPFSSKTTFTFQHNYSNPVNVKIRIYSVAGRMIQELDEWNILDKFVKVGWDGRDKSGNQIANGVYLYKLIVETSDGQFKQSSVGKLAVIR